MSITFKTIKFKNFLSVGNAPVEIDFRKDTHTLIAGTNGNGKSTILSALTFALFGKTIKNLNKPNLVNSINNKALEVRVTFDVGTTEYEIVRGVKPNVFEVYKDGKLLDQTAVRDYQEYIEKSVLKTNFRAFTQTTIISIENYVPFMKLKANDRRAFIEELLDINIFSTMNMLLKQQINETKEKLKNAEDRIASLKELAVLQKKHVDQIETDKKRHIEELEAKVKSYNVEVDSFMKKIGNLDTNAKIIEQTIKELTEQRELLKDLPSQQHSLKATLEKLNTRANFYHDAENCPTCKQNISDEHKHELITEVSEKKKTVETELESIMESIRELNEVNEKIAEENDKLRRLTLKIREHSTTISQLNRFIRDTNAEIETAKKKNDNIVEQKQKLKDIAHEVLSFKEQKVQLTEVRSYQEIAQQLLKDSGIKAQIIKQYIPVINKLVNKYLGMLDFFVSFELNENFEETIKSRHRDTFTYFNFSAGEQQRIDLALTFTFRQIAKMKNSFNSNLLMLDEILDSSLDSAGIDLVMQIFYSNDLKDTNIFVISHRNKDTLADRFGGIIELEKVNGFTKVVN